MKRVVSLALLVSVAACSGPDAPAQQPRRIADYKGDTPAPSADQCSLPVDQRTGGWFCNGTTSSAP